MSETHKPIAALFAQYLLGKATPEEIAQIKEWAALSTHNSNLLKRFNDHELLKLRLQQLDKIDKEARFRDFERRLAKHKSETTIIRKLWQNKHIAKLWRHKYEAAAAILCIILAAPYLYKLALTRDAAITPSVATTSTNSNQQTTTHHQHTETTSIKRNNQPAPVSLNKTTPAKKALPRTSLAIETTTVQSHVPAICTDQSVNNAETQPPTSAIEQQQMPLQFAAKDKPMAINKIGPKLAKHTIRNEDRSLLKNHLLPDRSLITLNAGTTINYRGIFTGIKRKIELNGEGYIKAKQADSFPFLVVANTVHIVSDGGTFNVRAYENEKETKITALTGSNLLVAAGPYQAIVQPGQMAVVIKGSPIEVRNSIDTSDITAYTSLMFRFNNVELNSVVAEIARWYGVQLVGTAPPHLRVSFTGPRGMDNKDLEDLITTINKLTTSGNRSPMKLTEGRLIIE